MNAALLLAQTYSAPNGDEMLLSALFWLGLIFLVGFAIVWRIVAGIRSRRQYREAKRAAHDFKPPNVHGSAGVASKDDARRKGWLK